MNAITSSNRPKDMEYPAGFKVFRCIPPYIRPYFRFGHCFGLLPARPFISVLVWFPQVFLMLVAAITSIPSSLMGTLFTRFWSCQTFLSLGQQRPRVDYIEFWIIFHFGTLKLVDPLMLQMMSILPSCYTGCTVTFCACLKSGSPLFFLF